MSRNEKMPTISVTLKDYKTGCQCIPAPPSCAPPPCPPPAPPPPAGSQKELSADRLKTPRKIELSGDATGLGYFDGSADLGITVTINAITNLELEELLK